MSGLCSRSKVKMTSSALKSRVGLNHGVVWNFPAFGETRFDACRIFRFVFQQPIEDRCCTVDSIPASLVPGSNPLGLISEQYTRGFVGKARFVRSRAYAPLQAISRMTAATLIRRTQTV